MKKNDWKKLSIDEANFVSFFPKGRWEVSSLTTWNHDAAFLNGRKRNPANASIFSSNKNRSVKTSRVMIYCFKHPTQRGYRLLFFHWHQTFASNTENCTPPKAKNCGSPYPTTMCVDKRHLEKCMSKWNVLRRLVRFPLPQHPNWTREPIHLYSNACLLFLCWNHYRMLRWEEGSSGKTVLRCHWSREGVIFCSLTQTNPWMRSNRFGVCVQGKLPLHNWIHFIIVPSPLRSILFGFL